MPLADLLDLTTVSMAFGSPDIIARRAGTIVLRRWFLTATVGDTITLVGATGEDGVMSWQIEAGALSFAAGELAELLDAARFAGFSAIKAVEFSSFDPRFFEATAAPLRRLAAARCPSLLMSA